MPPKARVLADFPVATSVSANRVFDALLGRHLPPRYLTEQENMERVRRSAESTADRVVSKKDKRFSELYGGVADMTVEKESRRKGRKNRRCLTLQRFNDGTHQPAVWNTSSIPEVSLFEWCKFCRKRNKLCLRICSFSSTFS